MLKPYFRYKASLPLVILAICLTLYGAEAHSRGKENRRRNDRLSGSTITNYASSSTSSSSVSASNQYNVYDSSSGSMPYVLSSASASSSSSSSSSYYNGPIDETGFCVRRRDMKLMCYCTPDENHVPVQKAECWVFSEGLLQNDTTWTRFYQQTRLRDLKFVIQNHGRLDYIPTHVIKPLENLTSITIEYSQVEIVRSYAFANLHQLERIVLTNNQIMAIDQEAFANHVRLRDLNLEYNQIFEIDRKAFRNLPLCERINLNNNNITNLHDGIFSDLVRLIYLNLAYNQISVLTSDIFKGLGNLNVLKLTHNNINFIGDTVFAELWSLTELELDDNKIERISERALDGLNNLKTLNLRNNLLKKIDNGLLRGTTALLSLNVQSNKLETLTFYTFQPIMDNLVNGSSELLLNDNNFICDCRLQWLYELKNRTRYQQLRDSLEDFICTLQEPRIHNFIEPVPTHVLQLLNVGGLNSGSSSSSTTSNGFGNKKRLGKNRQGSQRRGSSSISGINKFDGQMQLTEDMEQQQMSQRNSASLKKKRALTLPHYKGDSLVAASASSKTPVESHYIFGGPDSSSSSSSLDMHNDYFEAGNVGRLSTHPVKMEDELEMMKHNALFQQTNDIPSAAQDNTLDAVEILPKQPLGIQVRLFILKADRLPCHDELSDPTELPLSRDLMDVRSSNVQVLAPTNAASFATMGMHGILLLILAIVYGTQVG
ncbi:leucine rich repeat protein connectin [Haematobia irritans]|uniref:leucine rich repeat protein connectin n=1 Tax=Haematobia irritans TaxID=7368 RepID=UPI003F5016D7